MSLFQNQLMSRRRAIAGLLGTFALLGTESAGSAQADRPAPVDLGHGLEIRDYRLFPTEDVMRFLVEIHNTTATAVDTPSVGVVLPHLNADENFGWAIPMQPTIHPQSSSGLIGVAPTSLDADSKWGTPLWELCSELTHQSSAILLDVDVTFTHTLDIRSPSQVLATIDVSNHGPPLSTRVTILGLVRDHFGRIAGGTVPIYLNSVEPGESRELGVPISPTLNYTANPVPLLSAKEGVSVDFSLQPWPSQYPDSCAPVMPWS